MKFEKSKVGEDSYLKLNDHLVKIFVAHNFDQHERYNLLSFQKTQLNGLNGSLNLKVEEIFMTLNENYILLLSKLIDENHDEVLQIIPKLKKEKIERIEPE